MRPQPGQGGPEGLGEVVNDLLLAPRDLHQVLGPPGSGLRPLGSNSD